MDSIATIVSALAAIVAIVVAWKVYRSQVKLVQGQGIVPLWSYLTQLERINPEQPPIPAVIAIANTLELVGTCYENGLVDRDIMMRVYRNTFLLHYEDIAAIHKPIDIGDGNRRNGQQILKQYSPAATRLYDQLTKERLRKDTA